MPTSHVPGRLATLTSACALVAMTAGCSSVGNLLSNDKLDYRSSGAKTVSLEVPPDLSQLSGQGRYALASQGGTVSASAFNNQQGQTNSAQSPAVAAKSVGGVTLQRDGQVRWLAVDQSPEQVWPLVRDFWLENGFELPVDQAKTGVMETNWAENRAKLNQDGLRQLMGRVLDNLYDTGERDQFRTRIERTSKGTEIYVSHRGLLEVYTDGRKEQTTWKARPADSELEASMLSRLMVKLGSTKEAAQAATASTGSKAAPVARAVLQADGLSITLKGDLDQSWRRVGLALDRGGFTVEDRDRSKGVYDVRLASSQDEKKPGLVDKMLGWFGSSKSGSDTLTRYRLQLTPQGADSTVTVQTSEGKPADTNGAREVAKLLTGNLE
jgi:outer membrane protein assembly factor BamC